MKTSTSTTGTYTGPKTTVGDLRALLDGHPDDAEVSITRYAGDRMGDQPETTITIRGVETPPDIPRSVRCEVMVPFPGTSRAPMQCVYSAGHPGAHA